MPTCDVCGNEYDKAFQVMRQGRTMTFDSFECAIPGDGALLRALRLQDRRAWGRGGRQHLLLRSLRAAPGRHPRPRRLTPRGSLSCTV